MSSLNYKIPFLPDGSVPHFPPLSTDPNITWKEADYTFDGILIFDGCHHGKTHVYFSFINKETKATYTMFLSDMEKLLKNRIIAMGLLGGKWGFIKRGNNYGIQAKTFFKI